MNRLAYLFILAGSVAFLWLSIQHDSQSPAQIKAEIVQGQKEIDAAHASFVVRDEIAIRLWEKQAIVRDEQDQGRGLLK